MDNVVMANYPDVYEKEVLLFRKKELDDNMHLKFSKEINTFMKMPQFPVFQEIEIETINRCNGTCCFCPVNCLDDSRSYSKMSGDMFESIILQLASIQYSGRVGLYSNNEPLLDDRIIEFARYTKEKLPKACKIIYTNGTLLNKNIFAQLVQFLDIICLDLYYDNSIKEFLTDSMNEILEYGLNNSSIQEKVMLQIISRKSIRNNRGGMSKNRNRLYQVKATCMLPYIQMIVRPDGKISLCCNDALGRNTLGDLRHESLLEAWNNDNFKKIRLQILQSRQKNSFCKYCDNYASVNTKGNEEFSKEEMIESWNRLKYELEYFG